MGVCRSMKSIKKAVMVIIALSMVIGNLVILPPVPVRAAPSDSCPSPDFPPLINQFDAKIIDKTDTQATVLVNWDVLYTETVQIDVKPDNGSNQQKIINNPNEDIDKNWVDSQQITVAINNSTKQITVKLTVVKGEESFDQTLTINVANDGDTDDNATIHPPSITITPQDSINNHLRFDVSINSPDEPLKKIIVYIDGEVKDTFYTDQKTWAKSFDYSGIPEGYHNVKVQAITLHDASAEKEVRIEVINVAVFIDSLTVNPGADYTRPIKIYAKLSVRGTSNNPTLQYRVGSDGEWKNLVTGIGNVNTQFYLPHAGEYLVFFRAIVNDRGKTFYSSVLSRTIIANVKNTNPDYTMIIDNDKNEIILSFDPYKVFEAFGVTDGIKWNITVRDAVTRKLYSTQITVSKTDGHSTVIKASDLAKEFDWSIGKHDIAVYTTFEYAGLIIKTSWKNGNIKYERTVDDEINDFVYPNAIVLPIYRADTNGPQNSLSTDARWTKVNNRLQSLGEPFMVSNVSGFTAYLGGVVHLNIPTTDQEVYDITSHLREYVVEIYYNNHKQISYLVTITSGSAHDKIYLVMPLLLDNSVNYDILIKTTDNVRLIWFKGIKMPPTGFTKDVTWITKPCATDKVITLTFPNWIDVTNPRYAVYYHLSNAVNYNVTVSTDHHKIILTVNKINNTNTTVNFTAGWKYDDSHYYIVQDKYHIDAYPSLSIDGGNRKHQYVTFTTASYISSITVYVNGSVVGSFPVTNGKAVISYDDIFPANGYGKTYKVKGKYELCGHAEYSSEISVYYPIPNRRPVIDGLMTVGGVNSVRLAFKISAIDERRITKVVYHLASLDSTSWAGRDYDLGITVPRLGNREYDNTLNIPYYDPIINGGGEIIVTVYDDYFGTTETYRYSVPHFTIRRDPEFKVEGQNFSACGAYWEVTVYNALNHSVTVYLEGDSDKNNHVSVSKSVNAFSKKTIRLTLERGQTWTLSANVNHGSPFYQISGKYVYPDMTAPHVSASFEYYPFVQRKAVVNIHANSTDWRNITKLELAWDQAGSHPYTTPNSQNVDWSYTFSTNAQNITGLHTITYLSTCPGMYVNNISSSLDTSYFTVGNVSFTPNGTWYDTDTGREIRITINKHVSPHPTLDYEFRAEIIDGNGDIVASSVWRKWPSRTQSSVTFGLSIPDKIAAGTLKVKLYIRETNSSAESKIIATKSVIKNEPSTPLSLLSVSDMSNQAMQAAVSLRPQYSSVPSTLNRVWQLTDKHWELCGNNIGYGNNLTITMPWTQVRNYCSPPTVEAKYVVTYRNAISGETKTFSVSKSYTKPKPSISTFTLSVPSKYYPGTNYKISVAVSAAPNGFDWDNPKQSYIEVQYCDANAGSISGSEGEITILPENMQKYCGGRTSINVTAVAHLYDPFRDQFITYSHSNSSVVPRPYPSVSAHMDSLNRKIDVTMNPGISDSNALKHMKATLWITSNGNTKSHNISVYDRTDTFYLSEGISENSNAYVHYKVNYKNRWFSPDPEDSDSVYVVVYKNPSISVSGVSYYPVSGDIRVCYSISSQDQRTIYRANVDIGYNSLGHYVNSKSYSHCDYGGSAGSNSVSIEAEMSEGPDYSKSFGPYCLNTAQASWSGPSSVTQFIGGSGSIYLRVSGGCYSNEVTFDWTITYPDGTSDTGSWSSYNGSKTVNVDLTSNKAGTIRITVYAREDGNSELALSKSISVNTLSWPDVELNVSPSTFDAGNNNSSLDLDVSLRGNNLSYFSAQITDVSVCGNSIGNNTHLDFETLQKYCGGNNSININADIKVTRQDGTSKTYSRSKYVSVNNKEPIASVSLSVSPSEIMVGDSVTISAEASISHHDENDTHYLALQLGDNILASETNKLSLKRNKRMTSAGSYIARGYFKAHDAWSGRDSVDSKSKSFKVYAKRDPTVVASAGSGYLYPGDSTSYSMRAVSNDLREFSSVIFAISRPSSGVDYDLSTSLRYDYHDTEMDYEAYNVKSVSDSGTVELNNTKNRSSIDFSAAGTMDGKYYGASKTIILNPSGGGNAD